jgi:formylglycine-generating enzyme required for sulfatase activity
VFSEGQAYARTYTYSSLGPIDAADYATLGGLRLDKYEVTVGRFRQFVTYWNRHGYTPPPDSGKHEGHGLSNSAYPDASSSAYETGWLNSDNLNFDPTTSNLDCRGPDDAHYATWTLTPGVNETRPINCVNWYEAYAFCIWDGGFLPSEAEWEYVAAHGTKYLEFPWGQTPPGTSNQYAIYNCDYPDSSAVCSSAANIAPVGTAAEGASLIGPLDLAGNVAEWVLDAYAPKYANPCDECTYEPTSCNDGGCNRVFRGSDFSATLVSSLYPTYREFAAPTARSGAVGFRCARQ